MRQLLHVVILTFITLNTSLAQKQRVYLDSNWRITTKEHAYFYEEWNEVGGQIAGSFKEYYTSGQLKKQSHYVKDRLEGKYMTYYDNGQLESKGQYKKGELQGLWQEWYENGQLKSEEKFANNQNKGIYKEWHENGQMKTQGNFVQGMQNGVWESWHDNGQLESKGSFQEGDKTGEWKTWHENGQLASQGNYKGYEKVGSWTAWYENGQKAQLLMFQEGELVGTAEQWHLNGQKVAEYDFDKGILLNAWDQDGTALVVDGNGLMKHYNEKGKLFSTGEYKNGQKNGTWMIYKKDGTSTTHKFDKEDGKITCLETGLGADVGSVFMIVEENAEPVGGMTAFYRYIQKNLKYPRYAKRHGLEGKVFLSFVVNQKGEITFAKVVRGVCFSLDREALRIIRQSPNWRPGTQNGKPVKQRMRFPLNFRLK